MSSGVRSPSAVERAAAASSSSADAPAVAAQDHVGLHRCSSRVGGRVRARSARRATHRRNCLIWRRRGARSGSRPSRVASMPACARLRHVELAQDRRHVVVDGARREDAAAARSAALHEPVGEQRQHLQLARGQVRRVLARARPRAAGDAAHAASAAAGARRSAAAPGAELAAGRACALLHARPPMPSAIAASYGQPSRSQAAAAAAWRPASSSAHGSAGRGRATGRVRPARRRQHGELAEQPRHRRRRRAPARTRRAVTSSICVRTRPPATRPRPGPPPAGRCQSSSSDGVSPSPRLVERGSDAGIAPAGADQGQHQQPLEPRRGRVAQLVGEPDARSRPRRRSGPGSAPSGPSAPASTASTGRGRARRNARGPASMCGSPARARGTHGADRQVVVARGMPLTSPRDPGPVERPLELLGRRRARRAATRRSRRRHGV